MNRRSKKELENFLKRAYLERWGVCLLKTPIICTFSVFWGSGALSLAGFAPDKIAPVFKMAVIASAPIKRYSSLSGSTRKTLTLSLSTFGWFSLMYGNAAAAKSLQSCPTLCNPIDRQPTRHLRPWDSPGKNTGVGYHFLLQCMKVKRESEVAQSCPTLSDPMDCSLPGSSVHGIFQAKVLEWVIMS